MRGPGTRLCCRTAAPEGPEALLGHAARVVDKAFHALDAPPLRVCGPDTPVPNSLPLEAVYLNTESRLMDAVRNLAVVRHPKSKKTRTSS